MVENKAIVLGQVFLCLAIQVCAISGQGTELEEPLMSEAFNEIKERQGKENNPYGLRCFGDFPLLERHPRNNKGHGDVCRTINGKNWRCPKGCFKVRKGKSPFCKMIRNKKSTECRVGRDFSAIPTDCRRRIEWAFKKGKKKQNASKWYKRMKEISGVDVKDATLYDFQRFFKCTKKRFMPCRDLFFPKTCSSPPCNQCLTVTENDKGPDKENTGGKTGGKPVKEIKADCVWSEWNSGECSASCDGGNRIDARTKQGDDLNGGQCDPMIEKRTVSCNTESCPLIHCEWGNWTIGECSATCGVSTRLNKRTKLIDEANGGVCDGESTEIQECEIEECPVHCEWSAWEVGVCSKSCGGGTRTKSRRTDDNHHEDEPQHCPGIVNLEESCHSEECPVDCTWGEWEIGECACDTNEKEMVRKRNPELYGGAPCSGESHGITSCLEEECLRKDMDRSGTGRICTVSDMYNEIDRTGVLLNQFKPRRDISYQMIKTKALTDQNIEDALDARNRCEKWCSVERTCAVCSVDCRSNSTQCVWSAFTQCGDWLSWPGLIEGDISEKVGHPCDITIDDKEYTNANGGCAQICNKNGENVVCSCVNGYQLGDDGKSCDPVLECSWSDATDRDNILHCNDGYECDVAKHPRKWSCCRTHGGRAKCPRNSPLMCSERFCAGRSDHCCSDHDTNCGLYYNLNLGGERGCGPFYDLNSGPICKPRFVPITTSWQDCQNAAKRLGYARDSLAQIEPGSSFGTSKPPGCFQSDEDGLFYFNTDVADTTAIGTDKILCVIKGDCSCNSYVSLDGWGDCRRKWTSKNPVVPICYVNMPTTCSDVEVGLLGIVYWNSKGPAGYSWEACQNRLGNI